LLLSAQTFDGSKTSYPLRWAKKPTWSGTLTVEIDQPVPSGHQYDDYSADVVVSETGTNALEGTVKGQYTQDLALSACPSRTTAPGTATATLAGTIDATGTGMQLAATPGPDVPPTVTPCPGAGLPGLMGNPFVFPELADLFASLEPKGNNRYAGRIDVTAPGPATYHFRASLTLVPLDQDPVSDGAISMSPAIPPNP
jgi:hypothetical protein